MRASNYSIENIYKLIHGETGMVTLRPDIDIYQQGVVGDDFHELIEKYQKEFEVDMDSYLWYFHSDEEGINFPGAIFSKPPYDRVKRIPVTPQLLLKFANSGVWELKYPDHEPLKKRYDLLINTLSGIAFFVILAIILLYNLWI
ncbi:DUF1493 family protein [Marinoscillum pacificum]|uniref:DUF1493 family protein n=1 Tax=Marinoscillum pacificum TaxID=392723 RepID=UPI002157C51B|nr:DUF1493 family protein [Marinoscillum pacificum]